MTRHGTTRTVFLLGSYAFKIPTISNWRLFLQGLLANMQETLFSTVPNTILCPIVFSVPGGFLNVMPRCSPLHIDDFESAIAHIYNRDDGISYVHLVEKKIDSLGILNECIVVVDYGS